MTQDELERILKSIKGAGESVPRDLETLHMLYWTGALSEDEYAAAVEQRKEYELKQARSRTEDIER